MDKLNISQVPPEIDTLIATVGTQGTSIATLLAAALRKDLLQTPSQTEKGQLAVNAGQAWEQIGAAIDPAGLSVVAWTGLSAYRRLRLIRAHLILSSNVGSDVIIHIGTGGSYITTGYNFASIHNNDSTATTITGAQNSGTGVIPYPNNIGGGDGIQFDLTFSEFNKALKTGYAVANSLSANTGNVNYNFQCTGRQQTVQAMDCLRIVLTGAPSFLSGSLVLEGQRG